MSQEHTSVWEQEQATLAAARAKRPEAFIPSPLGHDAICERIGIPARTQTVPTGCIKFSPVDFIVEELSQDGSLVSIDSQDSHPTANKPGDTTVWADLVKTLVSTPSAVEEIARALSLPQTAVSYAGFKDNLAFTAQRIAIEGTTEDAVRALNLPHMVLKNIALGGGSLQNGELSGNRFSLFVRTKKPVDAAAWQMQLESIEQIGLLNYYGPQRFGAPRYVSHLLGKHLACGEYKETVKMYFCGTSPFENAYFTQVREALAEVFGNWHAMREIINPLPHSFVDGHAMLDVLEKTAEPDYIAALKAIDRQVKFWAYAYGSYLTNQFLGQNAQHKKTLAKRIPLLISKNRQAQRLYEPFTKQDGTADFAKHLRPFGLVIGDNPTLKTTFKPTFGASRIVKEGVALSFDLRKGAYATTVLAELFDLDEDEQLPSWLGTTEYDTKAMLGTGSARELRERFASEIDALVESRLGGAAAPTER